ncbi:MAG: BrnA antitoxin family protein [Pseudobutyrivibrio sp.]|nr:BrnA antitoxin family protein [Pseudobutyrivibrio sp.]
MKKTGKNYRTIDFPPLTEEQLAEISYINNMSDAEIDTSDIKEIESDNGGFYYFQSLKIPKQDIHTKIDVDNLEWLKQDGKKGYQARLNAVIRWARMNGCPISML